MGKHLYNFIFLLIAHGLGVTVHAQIIPTTATAPPSATAAAVPSAYPTGTKVNYVRTKQAVAPITDAATFEVAGYAQVKEATQYMDGLGRPLQTVSRQATPMGKDMVAPVVYDAFGREAVKYMPYIDAAAGDGKFKMNPFAAQATYLSSQYNGENIFYGKTVFEASPLNRPLKRFAPGNSWAGSEGSSNEHATGMQYLINDVNDAVRIWTVSNTDLLCATNMDAANIPSSTTTYNAGQLYKSLTSDESNKVVIEYKDKEGKLVLKKVQIDDSPNAAHTGWLCTYYVYDDFGQLRFVIPPKAVDQMVTAGNWLLSANVISELCFRYEYDERKRMVAKQVPGGGWAYMVYDNRDRLCFTQDANLRTKNQWLATLYDDFNRPITTGIITYAGCRYNLQSQVDIPCNEANLASVNVSFPAPADLIVNNRISGLPTYKATNSITITNDFISESNAEFETIIGSSASTTSSVATIGCNILPVNANFIALTITYYDTYSNVGTSKNFSTTNNSKLDDGGNTNVETLPTTASILLKGLVTATKVRVLEDPNDLTKGQWLETVNFYDNKSRTVQLQVDNYKNGVDISTMRYDFSGKLITTYLQHNNPVAGTIVKTKTNMLYDHAGRLLNVTKTLNDNTATTRTVTRNTYDELGQLITKKLGQKTASDATEVEALDYTYNVRGWLQGINKAYTNTNTPGNTSKWFGMQLNYDYGFTQSQFNGNIAGTIWKTRGSDEQRAYGYGYDNANRLLKGDFTQNNSGWNQTAGLNYNMKMGDGSTASSAYDANGNIMAMKQFGFKIGGNVNTPIDDLIYAYNPNSNKLKNVIDAQNDPATTLGDFRSSQTYMNTLGTKTINAIDYDYDVNGNMVKDLNKDITTSGITYNHLNLPATITVAGKGTITYTYDAGGNKLRKTTVDNTISPTKTTVTDYMGGGVYENNTLQFLGHEEGRFRPITPTVANGNASWAADYFVKDHLGNTRVVLTDEKVVNPYPVASMETANAAVENTYYANIEATRTDKPNGYPTTDNYSNPNDKVALVNGSGNKIGPSIVLKVMAGDSYDIRARSWYAANSPSPGSSSSPLTSLVAALSNGIAGASAGKATIAALQQPGILDPAITNFLNSQTTSAGKPKAYLNWVLFDEQFKFVSGSFEQVGNGGEFPTHQRNGLPVAKNGYLYVYVSNETTNINVFFDNLQVTHTKGPLVEETHYYPFGLTMSGIGSKAAGGVENRRKFNKGSELQNKEFSDGSGLELYATNFRSLDPQLGRWWQIDPKANESESPYVSMSNNPIRFNDPLGDTIVDAQIKADKNWGKAYNTWLSSKAGKRFSKLYSAGGKYGTTTVVFKTGKTNQDNSAQGITKTFSVDRKDGSSTELTSDKKYGRIDKVASGQSKDNYLKFEVTLREGDNMNSSTQQVEGGETVLHETQHVRADQQTLITDKAIISPYLIHRDFMKPATSEAYQERYGFYIENKQMWQADYGRQKSQGKVTSESDYINKKINDFRNY